VNIYASSAITVLSLNRHLTTTFYGFLLLEAYETSVLIVYLSLYYNIKQQYNHSPSYFSIKQAKVCCVISIDYVHQRWLSRKMTARLFLVTEKPCVTVNSPIKEMVD